MSAMGVLEDVYIDIGSDLCALQTLRFIGLFRNKIWLSFADGHWSDDVQNLPLYTQVVNGSNRVLSRVIIIIKCILLQIKKENRFMCRSKHNNMIAEARPA